MKSLLMLGVFFSASAVEAAELRLRVLGENINGKEVWVALHSSARGFPRKGSEAKTAKAISNFLGKPVEPYGFSREARGLIGPPSFVDAAFNIGDADVTQTLHLQ